MARRRTRTRHETQQSPRKRFSHSSRRYLYLSAFIVAVVVLLRTYLQSTPTQPEIVSEKQVLYSKQTKTTRIVRFPAPESRLVILGDIHGDYGALLRMLRRTGLIGVLDEWRGGRTVLVQVGDQQDRGDGERAIYKLLYRLQDEAASVGGAVHVLLGNHDVINSVLDFRYVTLGGFIDFQRPPVPQPSTRVPELFRKIIDQFPPGARPRAWAVAPGGTLSIQMAERQHVALIVGDTLFVHAGIALEHLKGRGVDALAEINETTRRFLLGYTDIMPLILQGPNSPVWMRTYSLGRPNPDGPECRLLYETLNQLNVRRIVVGHTVQEIGINSMCRGRVWRVDVGLSAAYGGRPEALQLYDEVDAYVVTSNEIIDGAKRSFE